MTAGYVDPNDDYEVIRRHLLTDTRQMRERSIDAMGSDTQLTLATVEFVMGWEKPMATFHGTSLMLNSVTAVLPVTFGVPGGRGSVPWYATDVQAVFRDVLPRMQDQLGFDFTLMRSARMESVWGGRATITNKGPLYVATFSLDGDGMVSSEDWTVARAICRAALKAARRWHERRLEQWKASLAPEVRTDG